MTRAPLTLQEAEAEIARLQTELAKTQAPRAPIAVVGMGCRYPGDVRDPDAFWDLLQSGRDVLRDIPATRWDVDAHYDPEVTVPGKMYVRQGYYLDDIDQFDPQFFGLSPREADSLDPQQRLVMEVSWETLEHAGIAPSSLKGGKTGVFVGQYWDDYSAQRIYATDNREIDRYAQLSGLRGLTAGRICHILDSHGPAIQLDTACSSSSLAVHLACQSLRSGESDLALAGGVSLVLAPQHLIGICQMTALSPEGRCKTFDASADGFGQGEGCGMIALKRLADARADGDRVLAVIQGSAVNHDGHARTVTTPSGAAQRAMLQEALADAGLAPDQVDYVETHGTGTPLGDPIEVSAIARVLCADREKPLYLGSVKTNVGHLDSAAGIVGLMKVVLSLQHETIPPHLNYAEPNRHIPWGEYPLRVPVENTPWRGAERFAGISAFGMSGTNVHLIVGAAPEDAGAPEQGEIAQDQAGHLLTLSAQSAAALPDLARRYAQRVGDDPAAVCASAATTRSHLAHRAGFVADDGAELAQMLTDFAEGHSPAGLVTGTVGRRAPKLAFLFTGQGAQYAGMGRALYQAQPAFRHALDHCAALLDPHLDQPLRDVMWSGGALNQTEYTQPALFAIEYALARMFQDWGITPDFALGHSIGEYAAACVAGVFSVEDAARLVAARGRLMGALPPGGQMVSVAADEVTVRAAMAGDPLVSIAAVNGPNSIVVSGDGAAVDRVVDRLAAQSVKTTRLQVSHAFHSPMMDPILEEFRAVAASVTYHAPQIPVVSNVTGQFWDAQQLTADYWVDHLRGAVRFADGIALLQRKKAQCFVEIGPKPTLLGLGRGSVPGGYGTWLPSLRPDQDCQTVQTTVAELYVRGSPVDWAGFYRHTPTPRVSLPNYPWRYRRCWTDVVSTGGGGARLHPLVHRRIDNASRSQIFESTLSAANPAYLDDHRVFGSVVFPASAFFEMAMVVARDLFGQREVALTNVTIGRALMLSQDPVAVQMVATPNADRFDFEISSRATSDADWVRHTSGTLERRLPSPAAKIDIAQTQAQFSQTVDIDALSDRFAARGLEYFPRFRAIEQIWVAPEDGVAFARLDLPAEAILPGDSYRLHPVLTDASFRIAEALFPDEDPEQVYLPFGIAGFSCDHAASDTVWVKATARQEAQTRVVDLELFDDTGQRVATVDQLTLRSVPVFGLKRAMAKPRDTGDMLSDWLYQITWEARETATAAQGLTGAWVVLGGSDDLADAVAGALRSGGAHVHMVPDQAALAAWVASDGVSGAAAELAGVLHLNGTDARADRANAGVLPSLEAVQILSRAGVAAKHWFVTQGAQPVLPGEDVSPWQAQLWGFARTMQVEHPDLLGGAVDLPPDLAGGDLSLLVALISAASGDSELAIRAGQGYVARLTRPDPVAPAGALALDPEATYLVTGGVGALGLVVAQYLSSCGARHLVLTGRSGVSTDDQRAALQALEDAGTKVEVVAADIAKPDDVARVIGQAPKLRGIVHAAGVLDDGMVMQQSAARFAKVAAPKVDGAWHLHQQTQDLPLDFFVLFSSVASVVGSPGQANYASANAFMDGLAHYRRHRGLAATAINWGPWADVGMASTDIVLQRLMKDGWQPMSGSQGCAFIGHLLAGSGQDGHSGQVLAQAAVLPVDWAQFAERIAGASGWNTLKHVIPSAQSRTTATSAAETAAARVKTAEPGARVDLIVSYLLERIAQTLRVPAADLDEYAQLGALGVDSLTAVELRIWVQGDLGAELAVEHLFTAPSIRDLAQTIDAQLGGAACAAPTTGADRSEAESQWLVCSDPRPDAALRLICFPYAGGGASAFKDWAADLPPEVELHAVQMPGRETRLAEPRFTDMTSLIAALAPEVAALMVQGFQGNCAFFGHSMGAIVAYELARHLQELGAPGPGHLFVSARAAPQLQETGVALRDLADGPFMDRLHQTYGAVPEAIRSSAELQRVFLPILRADVTLLETHADRGAAPLLTCPVTALGGESDPAVTAAMLAGWGDRTQGPFAQHAFPGDHFYIQSARAAVLAVIRDALGAAHAPKPTGVS